MAQLERKKRLSESPRTPNFQNSSSFEKLLKVEETYWSPTSSPTSRRSHDHVDPFSPSHKKSVLTIVKERAKKLKKTLSGRRKQENDPINDNSHRVPSWGVTLEDDVDDERDDDPEYLGAPMYESEAAPETLKETARQHPRAVPVLSEKHRLPNRVNQEAAQENDKPVSLEMTMTETVSEKLGPAYAAMSDATNKVVSKLSGLAIATQETPGRAVVHNRVHSGGHETARNAAEIAAVPPSSEAKKMSEDAGNMKQYSANSSQTWDKGVSVKEYFMHKLEPGEDERALSQAITEAISPRKTPTDTGVMEKVKGAVTSLFWQDETSNSMSKAASLSSAPPASSNIPISTQKNQIGSTNAHSSKLHHSASANSSTNDHSSKVQYHYSSNSSPLIPLSSNAYEVHEEENHGKILQAN